MPSRIMKAGIAALGVAVLLVAAGSTFAQETGTLQMSVHPPEAYTFVDGQAIGPGNHSLKLEPGNYKVLVANYGFKFYERDVPINPGAVTKLSARLDPVGTQVATGERGRIQVEIGNLDAGDAAVLLNGKTPYYFVGHVDEFNHNIIWKQELVVPPGTHQITITRHNKVFWSGPIVVQANQRVILDISNGKQRIKDWARGRDLGSRAMDRFHAGLASATVVVAPVSSSISASPTQINCGEASQLKWASAETVEGEVTGLSPVPPNGEQTVSPKQTTTYEFSATGPGGTTKSSAVVNVNPDIVANLEASPTEVRYRRMGDKVLQQETTTVNWSTSNAEAVGVDPFGTVQPSGSRSRTVAPSQITEGPVDETITYTLKASNSCGGETTKTARVHVVGSIEPIPAVMLHSVFFPTAYPLGNYPTLGLVRSQQQVLATLASGFVKYLEYDPAARLRIEAHADVRGTSKYNMALSDRRAEIVKQTLVANGVAEDKIDLVPMGEENPLEPGVIAELEAQNPNPMPQTWTNQEKINRLAYDRRVDIILLPSNEESVRFYPNAAPDSELLRQLRSPVRKVVENQ